MKNKDKKKRAVLAQNVLGEPKLVLDMGGGGELPGKVFRRIDGNIFADMRQTEISLREEFLEQSGDEIRKLLLSGGWLPVGVALCGLKKGDTIALYLPAHNYYCKRSLSVTARSGRVDIVEFISLRASSHVCEWQMRVVFNDEYYIWGLHWVLAIRLLVPKGGGRDAE